MWKRRLTFRTNLAQLLFKASGYLSKIKTYQKYYIAEFTDDDMTTKYGGRHWASCEFSMTLLGWAMQIDWDCWDHWALDHKECLERGQPPVYCGRCDEVYCEWEEEEE